jgi:hypothetical protein
MVAQRTTTAPRTRVESGEHAKVEERRSPAKATGVDSGRGSGGVHEEKVQISGHAEEDSGAKDGFVVIDEAIYIAKLAEAFDFQWLDSN